MMNTTLNIEQQAKKFLIQLDKSIVEALTLLQELYGENAMSLS